MRVKHNRAWTENKHCQEFDELRQTLATQWHERDQTGTQAHRDKVDAELRAEQDTKLNEARQWLLMQLQVEDLMLDEGFDGPVWFENVDPIPFGSKSPLGQMVQP